MGYPPMNLTILQLPAPSSNMTKAEYKQAYGIDLDAIDIKAFRLVVFGKEKYAIDQIKEVEDGIEIYFNGRIMSITDTVQVSDEVYNVANSTPLYFHPIMILKNSGDLQYTLTFIVINNRSSAYTLNEFTSYIDSIVASTGNPARFLSSGAWTNGEDTLTSVSLVAKATEGTNRYLIAGGTANSAYKTVEKTSWGDIFGTPVAFTDGVNKIN